MEKYVIRGGKPLFGVVNISGAKNAALAIIPATILVNGPVRLENVPNIDDVALMLEMLSEIGASVKYAGKDIIDIDTSNMKYIEPPRELVRKIRASYYFLGAMLGRFGKASVALPGGCDLGKRPIDQHIRAFEALGADVVTDEERVVRTSADGGLQGSTVYFDIVSVGATMNAILAATMAKGVTSIENAAKEPHIVDLANFLNSCGADIIGAGTDSIKIRGVDRLDGGTYSIIPDQIEAGTYMTLVAAVGGRVEINGVIPKHLEPITAKLSDMGVEIEEFDESVVVTRGHEKLLPTNIKTMPYPGFPTDMQSQFGVLMSLADGESRMTESIFDKRFKYTEELKRMGASVSVTDNVARFSGVDALHPAVVRACDLRAGAAMVMACLSADGVSEIEDIHHITRGYENLIEKLTAIGAQITYVNTVSANISR